MISMFRVAAVLLGIAVASASPGSVAIGIFSYDNLIPASPASPGVNVYTISNLTGDPATAGFALPPDFPVYTSLTLLNVQVTLLSTGSPMSISVGSVTPGFTSPASLQFADTVQFSSAQLTATLSATDLELNDGTSFHASAPLISVSLFPSSGPFLSPGTDFALIAVSDVPTSVEPEPATVVLLSIGILAMVWTRRSQSG